MSDSTLKPEFLSKYAGGRKVFVETGTARGEGLQVALDSGKFQKLYSIEANAQVFEAACTRFAAHANVEILYGDGAQVLPQLLGIIKEPAVFWLDSHWSTGEAPLQEGFNPCPVLAELRAIGEHPIGEHVILIDDVRYFWRGLPQWGNITVSQIMEMILCANPEYWIRFERGVTPLDILIATVDPAGRREPHDAVEIYERYA